MEFSIDPATADFVQRIRRFIDDHVLPCEADRKNYDEGENIRLDALADLRSLARQQGLWCLGLPREVGGQGLSMVGLASCYEEMSRSIFGPVVFNAAAPDDGNMMLLSRVGTQAQKSRWLQPIVDGRIRSAFAMTEPMPGAGSDPARAMNTTAQRQGDDWVIHGRKWFITGAGIAEHFVLVARTSNDARKGLTAFMFHESEPGWRIDRRIPILGPEEHGGHCEMSFDGLRIPDENRLLAVGDGLKVTQIRLGYARLTHCMRWLGLAKRCLTIACAYISQRESFGETLAEKEGVRWMLGEAAMAVQIGRLLTMRAAWRLDQGSFAKTEVSMAKIQVADALHKAADTALQLCGASGYSKDTIIEWIYRYARQARLVDGASEVHKMVMAQSVLALEGSFWDWN